MTMTERIDFDKLKRDKLLDLLRRATANGTHVEVAAAIADDWFPLCRVDEQGNGEVLVRRAHGEQLPKQEG